MDRTLNRYYHSMEFSRAAFSYGVRCVSILTQFVILKYVGINFGIGLSGVKGLMTAWSQSHAFHLV